MQKLTIIPENWSLAESLPFINDNFVSLLSSNAGTAFPQTNIYNGMLCYREDLKKAFVLIDKEYVVWYMFLDFTKIPVMKDYVDAIRIPIERIDGLFQTAVQKIKMELLETGKLNGQLVVVNNKNKIDTILIDTGTDAGKIPLLDNNAKLSIKNMPWGEGADQLVKLNGDKLIPDQLIGKNVSRFNAQGRLVFPNGNQMIVE